METVSRSIRLNKDVYERMEAVCAHLGVNANAYLKHVIGLAVAKDFSQLNIQNQMVDVVQKQLMSSLPTLLAGLEEEDDDD